MRIKDRDGIVERFGTLQTEYEEKIKGVLRVQPINEHANTHTLIEPFLITPFEELPTDIYKKVVESYKKEVTKHYTALGLKTQDWFDKEWFTRQMQLLLPLKHHEDLLSVMYNASP